MVSDFPEEVQLVPCHCCDAVYRSSSYVNALPQTQCWLPAWLPFIHCHACLLSGVRKKCTGSFFV